jgi:hypothetical protein
MPKRSFCRQETASLKNARRDGFLEITFQEPSQNFVDIGGKF